MFCIKKVCGSLLGITNNSSVCLIPRLSVEWKREPGISCLCMRLIKTHKTTCLVRARSDKRRARACATQRH